MQSTGGLINDIIVFGIFIYMSLLVSGKVKLSGNRQEKFNTLMERRGTLMKVVAYGGTVLIAVIILTNLL